MSCRKSAVYTKCLHTSGMSDSANVRRADKDWIPLDRIFMDAPWVYAQPKTVFIHKIHRVIHSAMRRKCRRIAVFGPLIHIIHRLSTGVIHYEVICGYSCGHSYRGKQRCLSGEMQCIIIHVRACSQAENCTFRAVNRPENPMAKFSKVTKMSNPQRNCILSANKKAAASRRKQQPCIKAP